MQPTVRTVAYSQDLVGGDYVEVANAGAVHASAGHCAGN